MPRRSLSCDWGGEEDLFGGSALAPAGTWAVGGEEGGLAT